MNESNINEPSNTPAAECCAEMEDCVRRNPTAAIAIAVGVGLAVGLLVRAMRPEPTARDRVAHMLEELDWRLRSAAAPVLEKVGSVASEGIHQGEAGIERLIRDGRRRIRSLFS